MWQIETQLQICENTVTAFSTPRINLTVNFTTGLENFSPVSLTPCAGVQRPLPFCTASGSWSGNKSFTGVQAFIATTSATHTLTCTNDQEGIVTRSVTIELEDGCEECLAGLGNREGELLSQTTDTSVSLAAAEPFTSTVPFPVSPLVIPPHPPLKTGNKPPASQPLVHPSAIQRVTYAVAGQAVVTHVTNDPVSSNNGLFYLYTDHLGSTTLLRKRGTSAILSGSMAYYLPFGSYRPNSTTPTQTITDKGFTGQKENMEMGLMYYDARFYAPGLGRFITADTIVPDPANPQSYNRYSYVRNSPLNYTDPSGHCEFGTDENGNTIITKWDCTVDDFDKLTWGQRKLWMTLFMQTTDVDWFYNIIGILDYFANDTDFSDSAWASYSDAGVLQAINDGWRIFKGEAAIGYWDYVGGSTGVSHQTFAAEKWAIFFDSLANNESIDIVRSQWGTAEQAGVDYGLLAAKPFANTASDWERGKIDYFVRWGNVYRGLVEGQVWNWKELGHGAVSQGIIGYFTDKPFDPRTTTSQKFVRAFSVLVISGTYDAGRYSYFSYTGP